MSDATVQIPTIPNNSKIVLIISEVTKPNLVIALLKANFKTTTVEVRKDGHTGIALCVDGSVVHVANTNNYHLNMFTTSKTLRYNQSAFFFMCDKDIGEESKADGVVAKVPVIEEIPELPTEPKPLHVPFTTQEEVDLLKNPPKELPTMSDDDISALNELCGDDEEEDEPITKDQCCGEDDEEDEPITKDRAGRY